MISNRFLFSKNVVSERNVLVTMSHSIGQLNLKVVKVLHDILRKRFLVLVA